VQAEAAAAACRRELFAQIERERKSTAVRWITSDTYILSPRTARGPATGAAGGLIPSFAIAVDSVGVDRNHSQSPHLITMQESQGLGAPTDYPIQT
jgi:hypothetical protein